MSRLYVAAGSMAMRTGNPANSRLRDALDVGKGEVLRDDRAPAVGAECDLPHFASE